MVAPLVYIRSNMEPAKSRHSPANSTPLLLRRGHLAIRISAYFLIASTAWVVFSDTLIGRLAAHLPFLTAIQISKGMTYTVVMSALLYIMLRRWENRLRAAAAREAHMTEAMADAITAMMKLRDPFTSWHTNRTVEFSARLGQALELAESQLTTLVLAARLHDIGNTGIPTEILNRPGLLSPPERALVQTHVHIAYEMMNEAGVPAPATEIVLQHHERLDGSGYPKRIRGKGIALEARILAVADVVTAMASHRPHRPAHDREAIAAELNEQRGIRYDAVVVDACLPLLADASIALGDA
jgi:HD-GYP domain-containing protein (c-di-GMP phosphodiesterase class II)